MAWDRLDCPEFSEAVREVVAIASRTRKLLPFARISLWDKINWGVALTIALAGLAAAPFSGGLSLIATLIGTIWIVIDILKKVREKSVNEKLNAEALTMECRVRFLEWCFSERGSERGRS